ncbi:hypothetical protein SteCoe_34942 [Stentor coeruleus]|uniref:Clathrin/coatomer adaptor adaptin-like N-terminal domain-containing protein n=1 Tax=Stentor coeruleus TaxID=5963 RepID=A0A1R2ATF1_9CILI|nr:hypothetical protein SteCoe_34942 [Stentor coeruleus]
MSKSATDVIKGLRKGKIDRTAFLTTVYSEIREEVKSSDLVIKTNAIRKLFILALEGYDMEWASFHILEVMSSDKFSQKHSGLLAASQCFKPNSDILFLATNFFRRELVGNNTIDTCISINTLSCIVNADMSKELLNDCVTLLNASKPILRKKVCILFYKLFLQYPDGLIACFERLAEKLRDESPGVVMGTVNTIYELSRINPSFVLFTAQALYEILNTTTNNFVIIKLIKLFIELVKVEPRLLKKISIPFTRILTSNPAKSVEFEVIMAICVLFHDSDDMLRIILQKLPGFLDSHDPNLKYLGLVILHKLIQINIEYAEEYKIFIMEALQSKDVTIRLRALELIKITTTSKSLVETIKNLLIEVEKPTNAGIKEELISSCLYLLSFNQYELVEDFKWMFEVLLQIVNFKTEIHEAQLSSIMLDVVLRVEELREDACELSLNTLEIFDTLKSEKCEALTALIFIIGEFSSYFNEENLGRALSLVTKPRWELLNFHESVYNALSSCVFKIFIRAKEDRIFDACVKKLQENSVQIEHMESQERSLLYLNILTTADKEKLNFVLKPFLPIHPSAQNFIFPPDALQQNFIVNDDELFTTKSDGTIEYYYYREEDFGDIPMTDQEKKVAKQNIKDKQMQDPYYIKPKKGKKKKGKKSKKLEEKVEEIKENPDIIKDEEAKKPPSPKKYSVNRAEPLIPT